MFLPIDMYVHTVPAAERGTGVTGCHVCAGIEPMSSAGAGPALQPLHSCRIVLLRLLKLLKLLCSLVLASPHGMSRFFVQFHNLLNKSLTLCPHRLSPWSFYCHSLSFVVGKIVLIEDC